MAQQTVLDPIAEFREDHRKIRDYLLDLAQTFGSRDVPRARAILGELDAFVGPHFRFEEESLYLALKPLLGEYMDKLIDEHEGAIEGARGLAQLLQKDALTQDEGDAARKGALSLLVHVSDCDGLAIMMERLSQEETDKIRESIEECRKANVPLLQWADTIRKKP